MTIKIADILYHARKKPMDHPESSILFAHLSKEVKEELLRLALSTLMNRALLNAETKDFYVILADVRTPDYPNGYYGTIQPKGARTPIVITEQSGNDLTDYAVKIELNENWDGWGATIDGSDIYFLDDQGNPLYYWIEYFNKTEKKAIIWVKIPSLPANSSITIYMHCGGDNPYSEYHDPKQVFIYYNDGTVLDFDWYPYGKTSLEGEDSSGWSIDESMGAIKHTVTVNAEHFQAIKKITLENFAIRIKWNLGDLEEIEEIGVNARFTDPGNRYFLRFIYYPSDNRVRYELVKVVGGTTATLGTYGFTPSANTWYTMELCLYGSSLKAYHNDQLIISVTDASLSSGYFGLHSAWSLDVSHYYDEIIVRPYVNPEPSVDIGASEFTEAKTANLQFPDGIDKILVTIDSDAQEAYYSIDGGQTWNPLTLDEEILLPETAYQLKLKFANLSYFRGYALVGW